MQAFLTLAESKIKSWIIKYGRQESVELMLHDYIVSSVIALLFIFEILISSLYQYLTVIFIFDTLSQHMW